MTVVKSQSAEAMLKQLKNPFDTKFVKVRVGATNKAKTKGIALFYLDAREVRKRLDEVCGPDGWQTEIKPVVAGDKLIGVMCRMAIKMPNGDWIWREDSGEPSRSFPLKGATSDAIKRVAVNFGVGAYLYYITNQFYDLDETGKKFKTQPQLPNWAMPDNRLEDWQTIAEMEYDPDKDIDLDELENLDYADDEAKEILEKSIAKRQEILAKMKAGKK